MAPRISIYMPNHNHAGYLPHSLASVCEQQPPPHEVFVFDDASTDDSCAIVESFRARYPFVHLIRYPAKAVDWVEECARHTARLTGEFVLGVGADDLLYPGCLQAHGRFLERWPQAAVVFPDYRVLDDRHQAIGVQRSGVSEPVYLDVTQARDRLRQRAMFETGVGTLVRRDAHEWLVRNHFHRMGPYSDSVGCVAIASRYGAGYLPEVLAGFRSAQQGDTYCQSVVRDAERFRACYTQVREFLGAPDVAPHVPADIVAALERKVLASLTPGGPAAYAVARYLLRLQSSRSALARGLAHLLIPPLRLAARCAEPIVVWSRRRQAASTVGRPDPSEGRG